MNLAGVLTAAPSGRIPSGGDTGASEAEIDPEQEAPEGIGFAALLELPSQPWASGWQMPDAAAAAGARLGAGVADMGASAERAAAQGDDASLPHLAGASNRDPLSTPAAALFLDPPAQLGQGTPGTAVPAPGDVGSLLDLPSVLPAGTAALPTAPYGDKGPAVGDGSLARPSPTAEAAGTAPPQPDHDLPARTLAMLDDALQRPVRLLAAASEPGAALQAAQPTPELGVAALPNAPAPAPLPVRETLPGHLHLAAARTPDGDESAEQINARLNWMANNQVGRAQIRLSPPHLGRVEIDLEIRDGKVRADFGATSAEARALLEAGLPRLREMFSAQGLQLVHSEVSSSLAQGQGQQADAQGRREPPPGEAGSDAGRKQAPEGEAGDAESTLRPVQLGRGLVDEFA